MDICPIFKTLVPLESPNWSGARMLVSCNNCGSFEISKEVYEELKEIAEPHWQIDIIQEVLTALNGL